MKLANVSGCLMIWSALPSASADADDPKEALIKSTEGSFHLLADTWTKFTYVDGPEAERFWIVRMQPLKTGNYTVVHDCRSTTKHGGYERREHKYRIGVLPAGTARSQTAFLNGGREVTCPTACLGDAVVLTFDLSQNYDDHHWTVTKDPEDEIDQPKAQIKEIAPIQPRNIKNSAAQFLRFTTIEKGGLTHATGRFDPEFYTSFEAVAPASFSFVLDANSSHLPAVPIVIVPKETNLNVFISEARERLYNLGGGSSEGDWADLSVEACVLRPGDIIRIRIEGAFDPSTPIQFDALPFSMQRQRYFWKGVKWKDY